MGPKRSSAPFKILPETAAKNRAVKNAKSKCQKLKSKALLKLPHNLKYTGKVEGKKPRMTLKRKTEESWHQSHLSFRKSKLTIFSISRTLKVRNWLQVRRAIWGLFSLWTTNTHPLMRAISLPGKITICILLWEEIYLRLSKLMELPSQKFIAKMYHLVYLHNKSLFRMDSSHLFTKDLPAYRRSLSRSTGSHHLAV